MPLGLENLVSLGFYGLFLVLAGLAVYRFRSRKMLYGLSIASVVLLGFILHGCPCPVGMFQNIVGGLIQPISYVPETTILLFVLPLLAALFFGRIFCSSVCPLGAVQELTAIVKWRVPECLEQVLGLFRWFWLGLGVFFVYTGLGYYICRFDPYVGLFRLSGLYPVMIFTGIMLMLGFFISRPFCRFLCPYGALLGFCSSLAMTKVTVTPGECTKCRLCEDICPYNAIQKPSIDPTSDDRRRGPRRLFLAVVILPVLVAGFATLGYRTAPQFAPWSVDVRTAMLLHAEEESGDQTFGIYPETRAAVQSAMLFGTTHQEIYDKAKKRFEQFRFGGGLLGAWFGLVLGLKLVSMLTRRRRTDYEVDSSRCVACGRCFWYCPNQKESRVLLQLANEETEASQE